MMHNWAKNIDTKNRDDQKIRNKIKKNIINDYVYVKNIIINKNYL